MRRMGDKFDRDVKEHGQRAEQICRKGIIDADAADGVSVMARYERSSNDMLGDMGISRAQY